ncbi:hypothetical protein [Streptococcus gordonii]|uniref:hypothetical protein n=1 Tax=Streptococcus gordonii TaxID=1302 RepID=UPI001639ECDB|nr:hypothetical protein [Streptococcus gordonii]
MRYALNAKKMDSKKLSKKKDKETIRRVFNKPTKQEIKNKGEFVAMLERASQMFAKRN